jgi:hypothetical protein
MATTYDPNWRQKALDIGEDQNSPQYAEMRALEASYKANQSSSGTTNLSSLFSGGSSTESTDLSTIYKNLTSSSGISGLNDQLTNLKTSYNTATSNINDNPFLSEASRVGRVQKLTTDYENSAKTINDQLTTKASDIETQMGLATKQIDINSAKTTNALNVYNSLLSSGALDNASASDLATIASSTGLSTEMIQSAIDISKKSKEKAVQIYNYDDGINQGYAVIDSQGNLIKTQVVAASKPEKTKTTSTGATKADISSAAKGALKAVDSNGDKAVSLNEFAKAVSQLMTATGADYDTAYDAAYQAMTALGFTTWKWSSSK